MTLSSASIRNVEWKATLAMALWILFAILLVRPSLHGGFLMDDYGNLAGLNAVAAHPDAHHVINFMLSGISSQIGRPLSLLTFALQAGSWPQDAYAFKYVNLLIHLLNGCLLLLLWLRIAERITASREKQLSIALTVFALWLVHPLQVTAVAYVVQRMVLLSATLSLLALLGYLHGRRIASQGRAIYGGTIAALSLAIGGLLAILAKETGLLVLIYALVLEFTLFRDSLFESRLWTWWRRLCLYVPLLIFAGIVIFNARQMILSGYANREFGLAQRLLTEPRVIWDYLANIVQPSPTSLSLFHDDYLPSSGLLVPLTTLPALLGLLGLMAAAVASGRRAPVLAFGLGWFLGGQLLESTVFPLELYFEHRNYLPLAGILTIAVYYLPRLIHRINAVSVRRVLQGAALIVFVELIGASYVTYLYWGHPLAQAKIWVNNHPDSLRASILLARAQLLNGQKNAAAQTLRRRSQDRPNSIAAAVAYLLVSCNDPRADIRWAVAKTAYAATAQYDILPIVTIETLIADKEAGLCRQLPSALIVSIVSGLIKNPRYKPMLGNLYVLRGRLRYLSGDRLLWQADFDTAFNLLGDPLVLLRMAQRLLQRHRTDAAAICYLRLQKALVDHPAKRIVLKDEVEDLRRALRLAADARTVPPHSRIGD